MNTAFFTVARAFIVSLAALLSDSLRGAIGRAEFVLTEKELYVKRKISAASSVHKLLRDETKKQVGVCSFNDSGYMAPNEAAAIKGIYVGYGTGASAADPASIAYNTTMPAELLNTEVVISQDGDDLFRGTIRKIISRGTETKTGEQYYELNQLLLLRDDRQVRINLDFPDAVAAADDGANSPFIYVSLDGLVTRKK